MRTASGTAPERRAEAPAALADPRFRRLMSAGDWASLPDAIRRRFSHHPVVGGSEIYAGQVLETWMTRYGRALAHVLRVIGAPLPLECDNAGAAAIVAVSERPDGAGQFWSREYVRRSGFPQVIHSTKRFAGKTGLEETVGCGITMSLRLAVAPGALYFLSDGYFLRWGRLRIPLPGALVLGRIAVGHLDQGAGAFDFTLDVHHPLLGAIIRQRVRFHDLRLDGGLS